MLSWEAIGEGENRAQSAFQLVIKLVQTGKIAWDSQKQVSASNQVETGLILDPSTRYTWTVQLWDEKDSMGLISEAATFSTALGENPKDWESATWIGRQVILTNQRRRRRMTLILTLIVGHLG